MALSGSFYTNVGNGWRLQLEWSGTQSVANNTTTVTAKLYWMSLGSSYTVSSSTSKTCGITISGSTDTTTSSGMASLSGGQKKLIGTYSRTITHDADGTASVGFDGYFDAEVTLSGTYYGRIDLTAKTYELNTIPRASSLTQSTISFTVGNSVSFGIQRASSSFSHDIAIRVNNVLIKTITGVGTATTWYPSDSETKAMFTELAKDTINFNQAVSVTLTTKNGSSTVGSKSYSGTASSPSASSTSSSISFSIGTDVSINVSRADTGFTHTLRFYVNNTLIKTITNVGTSTTWSPTSTEITNMYNATPSKTGTSKIEIDTLFDGVKIRNTYSKSGTATVTNSEPTFTASGVAYEDSNTTTRTLTGNPLIIIQNASTLRVKVPVASRATPRNGASISNYVATINGVTKTGNYSTTTDVVIDFGTISAGTDLTLTVKAVDSRGFEATVTKTVSMLAYVKPVLNGTARRLSGFENTTNLNVNGSISSLFVGGVEKNTTKSVKYRYKKTTEATTVTTWATWRTFTLAKPTVTTYSVTAVPLDLDNTVSWNVEFITEDNLTTTTTAIVVASGKPILFVDAVKKSVGVGKFPTLADGAFEVEGTVVAPRIRVTSTFDASGVSTGHGITVGTDTGESVKIDPNEVSSFGTGGAVAELYLNPDGGRVSINNSVGGTNRFIVDGGYILQDTKLTPSLQNGWGNYGTAYMQAKYWKDKNGIVHLEGLIKPGTATSGTDLFTLPSGYRPSDLVMYTCLSAGTTTARVDVTAGGVVRLNSGGVTTWLSLAGISFLAEN